jgi:hypothetical protein
MPDTSNDKPQDSPSSETKAATKPAGWVYAKTGKYFNLLILQGAKFLLTQRR